MVFAAPEAPLDIPEVGLTPFLLERAERHGDKPALIEGSTGRTITYREWATSVRKVATGLAARGLVKGGVVALYSPNVPEYAVAFHGVSLAGGVVTTINPLYTVPEVVKQLKDCGARYLVTVPGCVEKAAQAAREVDASELFVFGEAEGATPFAALLDAGDDPPAIEIDPHGDVVVLPYSSGTTGLPKGVMLTHHNLVANILMTEVVQGIAKSDVSLALLPFFHIYGMTVIMNAGLYVGATLVTMPRFDLEQFLDVLANYRVTFANLVPPIVLALAKSPIVGNYDLSALRVVFSGAAPLSEHLVSSVCARLGCSLAQGYGLTETSPVAHAIRPGTGHLKPGGVGPPAPNTESKVIDITTGEALGPHMEGEICIRGPQVMKGYLNRPDATRAMIDAGGWLHTGDIGYADTDGCFFIVDRLKELIKFKGMQIAPAELEAVLLEHPAIADAAVIPLSDEEAGEVPKAFVVLKDIVTSEEIIAYVAERVAPYKKVRFVEFVDQIPKSPSGKILRRVLVARGKT